MTGIEFPQGLPSIQPHTKPSLGQGGQSANNAKAWQREMERSQMAGWFHAAEMPNRVFHPVTQSVVARIDASRLDPAAESPIQRHVLNIEGLGSHILVSQDSGPTMPLTVNPRNSATPKDVTVPVGAASPAANLVGVKLLQLAATASTLAFTAIPVATVSEVTSHSDVPVTESTRGEHFEPAVRLHAQWQGIKVHVWLGVSGDRSVQELKIQAIIAELKRALALQGEVLECVVCNGRTVFHAMSDAPQTNGQAASVINTPQGLTT